MCDVRTLILVSEHKAQPHRELFKNKAQISKVNYRWQEIIHVVTFHSIFYHLPSNFYHLYLTTNFTLPLAPPLLYTTAM
jgi:hypothetical protein